MALTVGDIMRELHRFFPVARLDGTTWRIRDGKPEPRQDMLPGDWIAIRTNGGSSVYRLDEAYRLTEGDEVKDGCLNGTVWLLSPPPAFLVLCEQIARWEAAHPRENIRSESFGGYRRTMAAGADGVPVGWRQVFSGELAMYRRMFPEAEWHD